MSMVKEMSDNARHTCNAVMEQAEHVGEQVQQVYHQAEDKVREYPLTAALTMFGVGVGLGMLVTCALLPPRRQSWYSSDRMQEFARSVAQMLPDSLARRFA